MEITLMKDCNRLWNNVSWHLKWDKMGNLILWSIKINLAMKLEVHVSYHCLMHPEKKCFCCKSKKPREEKKSLNLRQFFWNNKNFLASKVKFFSVKRENKNSFHSKVFYFCHESILLLLQKKFPLVQKQFLSLQ